MREHLPLEKDELEKPCPRKIDGERVIYTSRPLVPPSPQYAYGRPILADLGNARIDGGPPYTGDIQPYQYRAPEVILMMPWDEKVDIWNVAVMVSSRVFFQRFSVNEAILTRPWDPALGYAGLWEPLQDQRRGR